MKILLIQNKVFENKHDTIKNINDLIKDIDFTLIDFIVFPEMFTTPYELKYFHTHKEKTEGSIYNYLSKLAHKTNSYVIKYIIQC